MRIVGIVVALVGLYFCRHLFVDDRYATISDSVRGLAGIFMVLTGAGLGVAGTYPDRGWAKVIGWVAGAGFRTIMRFVIR